MNFRTAFSSTLAAAALLAGCAMHGSTGTNSTSAGSKPTLGAAPDQGYRDVVPMLDWKPHVTGDLELSNTYPHWKDRKTLDPKMVASLQDQWKTNWKFMDPSYDQSLHGGYIALDRGKALFAELDKGGSFAACLGAKGGDLRGLRANHYPHFNDKLGRVVGLEEMIEVCSRAAGRPLLQGSYDNSAVSLHVASFSNGMPIQLDVSSGPLKDAFERGRERFHVRVGSNNFACASCHTAAIGSSLRGQKLTTPYGDAAHWPTYRTKGELQALHVRFSECNRNAGTQPLRPGSPAYTDIEVFLTALSNGYPVDVPSSRD
jgi:sulfur-oxidizing protein SoxA